MGACPPFSIPIAVPCRCGETTRYVPCAERQSDLAKGEDIVCDKVCKSIRLCGKHECTRVCCPAHQIRPQGKGKGKKKQLVQDEALEEMERAWHTCEFVCGKQLTCGLHTYVF